MYLCIVSEMTVQELTKYKQVGSRLCYLKTLSPFMLPTSFFEACVQKSQCQFKFLYLQAKKRPVKPIDTRQQIELSLSHHIVKHQRLAVVCQCNGVLKILLFWPLWPYEGQKKSLNNILFASNTQIKFSQQLRQYLNISRAEYY